MEWCNVYAIIHFIESTSTTIVPGMWNDAMFMQSWHLIESTSTTIVPGMWNDAMFMQSWHLIESTSTTIVPGMWNDAMFMQSWIWLNQLQLPLFLACGMMQCSCNVWCNHTILFGMMQCSCNKIIDKLLNIIEIFFSLLDFTIPWNSATQLIKTILTEEPKKISTVA